LQPALYILYADIRKIEFDRQAGVTSKTFNMTLEMKRGASHTFSSIGAYVDCFSPSRFRGTMLLLEALAVLVPRICNHAASHAHGRTKWRCFI
jgi:hypothetical protein